MAKKTDMAAGEPQEEELKLTPKQEAFARAYVETGNASEAYRMAYNVSESAKPEGIWVSACRTLAKTNVSLRVKQLKDEIKKKHEITAELLTEGYFEAWQIAKDEKQATALTGAVTALGKLHGLITEKVDHAHKHDIGQQFEAFIRSLSRERDVKTIDHDG